MGNCKAHTSGSRLRVSALAIAVVLVTAAFVIPARAETQGACNSRPLASLPLTLRGDGTITVDADIGAPHPLAFVVDLTHVDNLLRDDVATALGLARTGVSGGEELYRGGKQLQSRGVIPSVKLSGIDAGKIRPFLFPGVSGIDPFTYSLPAGVLGRHVFDQFDVELDLAGSVLNLFAHADCPLPLYARMDSERVRMDLSDEGLGVPVLLDGKQAVADLHTATCCSQISLTLAHDLLGVDASGAGLTPLPVSGGPPAFRSNIETLTLGATSISKPPIAIVDMTGRSHHIARVTAQSLMTICDSCQHVQVGLRELARFHLYFAFDRRILFVAPATP